MRAWTSPSRGNPLNRYLASIQSSAMPIGEGMDITIQGERAQQARSQLSVFSYACWWGHRHHDPGEPAKVNRYLASFELFSYACWWGHGHHDPGGTSSCQKVLSQLWALQLCWIVLYCNLFRVWRKVRLSTRATPDGGAASPRTGKGACAAFTQFVCQRRGSNRLHWIRKLYWMHFNYTEERSFFYEFYFIVSVMACSVSRFVFSQYVDDNMQGNY